MTTRNRTPQAAADELPEVLEGCRLVEREFTDEDLARLARHDRALLAPHTSRRACVAKRRVSERAARRDARCLRERGELVHAYACDRCGGWHVGHVPVAHVPATHRPAGLGRPASRPRPVRHHR